MLMNFSYLVDFKLKNTPIRHSDVLVIGGGIAGLTAAVTAADELGVQVLTKGSMRQTSTWHAQGGIAAPLAANDSPELHYQDTIVAGAGLCDPEAVKTLVEEAAPAVDMLLELGTRFDRRNGSLSLGREGGHTVSRVVHVGDATGSAVMATLANAARDHANITLSENVFVLDLIVQNGRCRGALVYDEPSQNVMIYLAQAVVLAAGGMGQIYEGTTNPPAATGDGLAMACRQGVKLAGLEFIQFHPTALAADENPRFLISEAVRGEGAYLVNKDGVRFMVGRHPLAELAPRDVVSQAVVEEMRKDGADHVYLDTRHLSSEIMKARFPIIWAHCLEAGFDMATDLVPVTPAAHYLIGGIVVDLHGRSSLRGLFAAGEVASTGVHGANRLASNSLLEGLVFSRRIGALLLETIEPGRLERIDIDSSEEPGRVKGKSLAAVRKKLRRIMTSNVGVIRTTEGLKAAAAYLDSCRHLQEYRYNNPEDWETVNMLLLAELVVDGALSRTQSLGVHMVAG